MWGVIKHLGCAIGHALHLVADQVEKDPAGAASLLRTAAGAVGVPIPGAVNEAIDDVAVQLEKR